MVCKECEKCWNYQMCENGCFGNIEPCEHLITGQGEMGQAHTEVDYKLISVFDVGLKKLCCVRIGCNMSIMAVGDYNRLIADLVDYRQKERINVLSNN